MAAFLCPDGPKVMTTRRCLSLFGHLEVLFSLAILAVGPIIIGQERLRRSLKPNKINIVTLDSRTTNKYLLYLSTENGEEVNRTSATTFFSNSRPATAPIRTASPRDFNRWSCSQCGRKRRTGRIVRRQPAGDGLRYFESGDSSRFWIPTC